MQYGCIGETLKHSFSAEIHPLLTDDPYVLCEVAKADLDAFMTRHDFLGINVTIPYKQAVIPYLCELDPQAKAIGAVNTVVNRNGRLYGYNTDFYGMCELIRHIGVSFEGKKVAILGTGGTSLTAMQVAKHLGAGAILRVSRSAKDEAITYEELRAKHGDVQVIINTTPCGMYPHANETPVELNCFSELTCVADAVYNPLRTRLVSKARERGIPAEGGLFMLVAQAVRASEIFHDCTYPTGTTERIFRLMECRKENIVLIGMPGSGKTTVGELLAEQLGRTLHDTDRLLTERAGRTPAEIIETDGEADFRDLESCVIKEQAATLTGAVIATGGGAVLREENVQALKQNGRLYWLDRPWQKLVPTSDRPLSSTAELLERRYAERYEIYRHAADVHIEDPDTPNLAAEAVKKEFEAI